VVWKGNVGNRRYKKKGERVEGKGEGDEGKERKGREVEG